MKFFRFRAKNRNVFFPSYLNATQRKLTNADPRSETRTETISELGSGKRKSKPIPIKGAQMTIEVREYFSSDASSPKTYCELDSMHTCKKSAFSKHEGQYSVTFYLDSIVTLVWTYGWLSGSPYLLASKDPSLVVQRINKMKPTTGMKINSQDQPDLPTSCILRVQAANSGIAIDKVSKK